jgi:hypothetical protein
LAERFELSWLAEFFGILPFDILPFDRLRVRTTAGTRNGKYGDSELCSE